MRSGAMALSTMNLRIDRGPWPPFFWLYLKSSPDTSDFSLQIQPKMRRYFPRQRDGTFAGRTGDGYAFAGRLTGRPHRRGDADASASQHKQRASRTCPASRDRVDLYCELVLPSTLGEDMISDTELAELDRRHAARPNGGSGDVPEKDTVYHLRKGRSR